MSKIANAFKDGKAFIGFLTAGDPTIEKTVEYILAMEEAGCDLIEIGIPFSDPMAEGVVIQDANIRALGHNTTTDDVFEIREIKFLETPSRAHSRPTGIQKFGPWVVDIPDNVLRVSFVFEHKCSPFWEHSTREFMIYERVT